MTEREWQKAVAAAREMVKGLRCDTIDVKPQDIDWHEALGEDMERWTAYETLECSECGRDVVTSMLGEFEHCDVDYDIEIDIDDIDDGSTFKCLECDEAFAVKFEGADGDEFACPHCKTEYWDGAKFRNHCKGYLCFEGPMMNYWYPVQISDCEEAARKIAHLPLCVVEFGVDSGLSGQTGLALTGGGMDLSPEICRAYIALGFMPPAHFARLPKYAGWEKYPHWLELLVACETTFEVQAQWANNSLKVVEEMLDAMHKAMTEEAA